MAGGYRAARRPVVMQMKPCEHLYIIANPSIWGRANNGEFWQLRLKINRLMMNVDILSHSNQLYMNIQES